MRFAYYILNLASTSPLCHRSRRASVQHVAVRETRRDFDLFDVTLVTLYGLFDMTKNMVALKCKLIIFVSISLTLPKMPPPQSHQNRLTLRIPARFRCGATGVVEDVIWPEGAERSDLPIAVLDWTSPWIRSRVSNHPDHSYQNNFRVSQQDLLANAASTPSRLGSYCS